MCKISHFIFIEHPSKSGFQNPLIIIIIIILKYPLFFAMFILGLLIEFKFD